MAKFFKIICCLLFAVAIYATANVVSATERAERMANDVTLSLQRKGVQASFTAPQTPYLPDAELAGAGMQVQQVSMSRIQRIHLLEYLFSVKSNFQKLADRDAVLSQHWCRLYETTTSYCCHPVSEYYVFALRRIIV